MTDQFKIDKSIALKEAQIIQKTLEKAHIEQEGPKKVHIEQEALKEAHIEQWTPKKAHIEQEALEEAHIEQEALKEAQVPENWEILLSYVHIGEKWDLNNIAINNIFAFQVALDIIRNDEDPEPQNVEEMPT